MSVFVLDKRKKPLMPCSEKRARLLLERGRARIARRFPVTIRLVDRRLTESVVQPVRVKIDPGSKTTRFSVVRDEDGNKASSALFLAELQHRGAQISEALTARRAMRRRRRGNLRYRPARFENRTTPKGWLAPSLQHRVDTTRSWIDRFRRLAPVTGRFDMQLLENPDISGVGYQQGTLAGYELREFLLNKWGRDGFPRGHLTREKRNKAFQTGDMVTAVVEKGVHLGRWIGRVAVRARGSFNIHTAGGVRQGVGWKSMRVLQRADGYRYSTTQTKKKDAASSLCLKAGVSAASSQ